MDWIGKKARGINPNRSLGKLYFGGPYKYGYGIRGIIRSYNSKMRKYKIEGVKIIVTPDGEEYRGKRGSDYFYPVQIQILEDDEEEYQPAPGSTEPTEPTGQSNPSNQSNLPDE